MATECGVFAGIHTARRVGTTQTPCFVPSVITPFDANNNWSSGCECSTITCPLSKSADTLAISPRSRPFAVWSMLWHLCDISCHDIERNRTPQVLFLRATKHPRRRSGRQAMLASGKMVGFIPTKDYDKARAFYEGKLGFEFVSLDKFALVMSVGGHMIRI